MGWVRINPKCRHTLHRQGLLSAVDFLRLPGVILCGHPDRHVLRVEGGFLKKEHRVPWRDRLSNAWAGFGFVSKSTREAKLLSRIAQAGIPCPEVLADGADGRQAFLLLAEKPGMIDLREYIQRHPDQHSTVARALGQELARIHSAGFEHGDLYTKHILAGPGPRFCFLDWQRARHRARMSYAGRCRDLAALDATLPESLVTDRVRLGCLRTYTRSLGGSSWKASAIHIRHLSLRLGQKSRIRALRRLPLPWGTQNLVWLDGDALCLTQAFHDEIGGQIPGWLRFRPRARSSMELSRVPVAAGRDGNLLHRTVNSLGRWLLSWWRKGPVPEVQLAALLFRLERHDVPCPKLLAFGHRRIRPWRQHSFILTEIPRTEGALRDFLTQSTSATHRGNWLRQAGALLRRLHEAGYCLGKQAADFAATCAVQKEAPRLMLTQVDGLERKTESWPELAVLDLPGLRSFHPTRGPEIMRFFLGYLGTPRITPEGRALARRILARPAWEVAR